MIHSENTRSRRLLLMIAGVKGTVASTVAVAVAAMKKTPEAVLPSLTTRDRFPYMGHAQDITLAGWDIQIDSLSRCVHRHGVLPENIWAPHREDLDDIAVFDAPPEGLDLNGRMAHLTRDIQNLKKHHPDAAPVMINLLPACGLMDLEQVTSLSRLYSDVDPSLFPDLAYVLAAILSEVPVVNFTPNHLEVPVIVQEAVTRGVPMAGYDGKTGQTYLKVALASALKARSFYVDGWYSLNILGNADGKNLMDPEKAAGKVANKTDLLDDILGYPVGDRYDTPSHKIHIDYYPPRGDAKEAWDVIDFQGMFGLPMSIRLNLQGRDSVLAAPLVLDLARWMAVLKTVGRAGPVPELAFYFKKPLGENPPLSFQDQILSLEALEKECDDKVK
jgi:myo-inositol-1-phosphate synthase